MRPLDRLLVLDLTRLLPGAVATETLAAFGARVIKIEQPGLGDYARRGFADPAAENPLFAATNRGKESVELDLKTALGKEALRKIASQADVLIEGFRPGVMDRLDLGFDQLRAANPGLIWVALSGYGQTGEHSQRAGHDINYMAMAGVLDQIGTAATPMIPGVQLADLAGGSMQVVTGVLLALAARARSGEGQFVDVSMTHGVSSLLTVPLSAYWASGALPERGNDWLTGRYACYGVYRAAEGFVAVGALEPKFWGTLCNELGLAEFAARQFDENQQDVKAALAARFAQKTAEEWFTLLGDKDCCLTPVRDLATAVIASEPQPALRGTPGEYSARVPALGEHTHAVLREFDAGNC
ncbi:MAG: CaiB/BaiF CoA-transferase family protein [Bryobacteraceae bacterium]